MADWKTVLINIKTYRYSEFNELNTTLKKIHTNLPPLPGKSFFKLSGDDIKDRKEGFSSFIKGLVYRAEYCIKCLCLYEKYENAMGKRITTTLRS